MREFFATNVPNGASLGYTLYLAGSAVSARTTDGITTVGTGTGVYRALIPDSGYDLVIWDTGGANPVYATETIAPPCQTISPVVGGASISPVVGGATATIIAPTISGSN